MADLFAGAAIGVGIDALVASSKGGRMTATDRPGSAFTRAVHGLAPPARASTTYSPGSTGTATPHKLGGSPLPLRFISTPFATAVSGTVTVSLGTSGSSASA